MSEKIAVVGLGYVGLPLAHALSKEFKDVVGIDISYKRILELKEGYDRTGDTSKEELQSSNLSLYTQYEHLQDRTFIIVALPTPVDKFNQPDIAILTEATQQMTEYLQDGTIVVYESTVYPGITRHLGDIITKSTSKKVKLGYSPERINPGDKKHTLSTVTKIIAGEDAETLARIKAVYGRVAQVYEASSIEVAEAAKVIENTQRDVNIALMNELAIICDRINIRTSDVLRAAQTKWNFLPFTPGLVGGHCIGVDPYYLAAQAESLGIHPQVILAGRRINDSMGKWVAQKCLKLLSGRNKTPQQLRVAVLGVTFKENVPDLRNSRVFDLIRELEDHCITPFVVDPFVTEDEVAHEAKMCIPMYKQEQLKDLDMLILAVPHAQFLEAGLAQLLQSNGIVIDVKSALANEQWGEKITYWSL